MIERHVVLPLRVFLVVLFGILVVLQTLSLPGQFAHMAQESPERLRSIRDELLAITSKHFWEVVDRGTNFDYLDDARKARLREFFGWFGRLEAPPTAVA